MNALETLLEEISKCRLCTEDFHATKTKHAPRPVVRVSAKAKILIVGQAPGARVHESGLPFDDRSGDRLREWLGVNRAEFYDREKFAILPMGFCFPGYDERGNDLPPQPRCAKTWRQELLDLLPEMALTLVIGQYAQKWHLGDAAKKSVTDNVQSWREYSEAILPLPHPSWRNTGWLKKNPWFEREMLPELQKRVGALL